MGEFKHPVHYKSYASLKDDLDKLYDLVQVGGRSTNINYVVLIDKDSDLTQGFPLNRIHAIYLGNFKKGYTLARGQSFQREKRILENLPWKEILEVRKTNDSIRDLLKKGAETEF